MIVVQSFCTSMSCESYVLHSFCLIRRNIQRSKSFAASELRPAPKFLAGSKGSWLKMLKRRMS